VSEDGLDGHDLVVEVVAAPEADLSAGGDR